MQVTKKRLLRNENLRKYLGLASVPLPHPVPQKGKSWERVLPTEASNIRQGSNQVSQQAANPALLDLSRACQAVLHT